MRRAALASGVFVLCLVVAVLNAPRGGGAQDAESDRLSALETQVAEQAKDIASLQKRVKKLEKPTVETTSSDAGANGGGVPIAIGGEGPDGVQVELKAGTYQIDASVHIAGLNERVLLFIEPPGVIVFDEMATQGEWSGTGEFTLEKDATCTVFFQKTTVGSAWTVILTPK